MPHERSVECVRKLTTCPVAIHRFPTRQACGNLQVTCDMYCKCQWPFCSWKPCGSYDVLLHCGTFTWPWSYNSIGLNHCTEFPLSYLVHSTWYSYSEARIGLDGKFPIIWYMITSARFFVTRGCFGDYFGSLWCHAQCVHAMRQQCLRGWV